MSLAATSRCDGYEALVTHVIAILEFVYHNYSRCEDGRKRIYAVGIIFPYFEQGIGVLFIYTKKLLYIAAVDILQAS